MTAPYIGQSVPRRNDRRLLTGAGTYVDDVHLPGTLHAAFVRSPHAHARILSVDTTAAREAPGVVAVFTGAEVAQLLRPQVAETEPPVSRTLRQWPLAVERARYFGDAVAVVVADDAYRARDAAARVVVEYDPLLAVTDAVDALAADAPLVYPEWGDNVAFRWERAAGDVDRVFAEAEQVVTVELRNQRIYAAFI
ncbi:MAG: xanthine dehydrogenase family protein molybdopterin-binding subunit, partial [Thermomicrobiales bacterium]